MFDFAHCLDNIEILAGGMAGADIGVGWVDSTGKVFFQV